MPADLQALRHAADLLDEWAKTNGYTATLNDTDPDAGAGIRLYASVITSLVAKVRAEAADLRLRAVIAEASPESRG